MLHHNHKKHEEKRRCGGGGVERKDGGCPLLTPGEEGCTCDELHRLIAQVRAQPNSSSYFQDQKWQAVRQRVEQHPEGVMVWDSGRTVLMAAVATRAPLPILSLIFKESARFGMETARDQKTGMTALLMAVEKDAPLSTIRLLLSHNGAQQLLIRNHQGTLPLHSALSRFLARSSSQFFFDSFSYFPSSYGMETVAPGEQPGYREDLIDLFLKVGPTEEQCLAENDIGLTPLHVALENKMPCHIIRRIVQACPKAVSRQSCGYTPLVAAIREDASIAIVEYLISVDPRSTQIRDIEGKYPLRRCIDRRSHNKQLLQLLCTCPEAVTTVDIFGRNLMQLLLEQWTTSTGLVDPDIVKMFLEIAPRTARDSRRPGLTCSDACSSPLLLCYAPYREAVESLNHPRERRRKEAERLSKAWWEIMQHLMQAMANDVGSPLRAAIVCNAPFDVVQRLLKEQPECARVRDAAGHYPLHWIFRRHLLTVEERSRMVSLILDTAPEMARVPDVDGRLALHLAIERGGFCPKLLSKILHAHPPAVSVLDTRYGLHPCFVAATIVPDSHQNGKEETEQLDAIFTLLQAAPEVLSP